MNDWTPVKWTDIHISEQKWEREREKETRSRRETELKSHINFCNLRLTTLIILTRLMCNMYGRKSNVNMQCTQCTSVHSVHNPIIYAIKIHRTCYLHTICACFFPLFIHNSLISMLVPAGSFAFAPLFGFVKRQLKVEKTFSPHFFFLFFIFFLYGKLWSYNWFIWLNNEKFCRM